MSKFKVRMLRVEVQVVEVEAKTMHLAVKDADDMVSDGFNAVEVSGVDGPSYANVLGTCERCRCSLLGDGWDEAGEVVADHVNYLNDETGSVLCDECKAELTTKWTAPEATIDSP